MSTSFVINTNVSAVLDWLRWWVSQGGGARFVRESESIFPQSAETDPGDTIDSQDYVDVYPDTSLDQFGVHLCVAAFEDGTRRPDGAIRLNLQPLTGERVKVTPWVYGEEAVECCITLMVDVVAQWPELYLQLVEASGIVEEFDRILRQEVVLKLRTTEQETSDDGFREGMIRLHGEEGDASGIVEEFARFWREGRMEEDWERLKNASAPQDRTFLLYSVTEMLRDKWRDYLKAQFGLVLDCQGALTIHTEPNARAPSSPAERCCFLEAVSHFLFHETTRREMLRAIGEAHKTGQDEDEKAFEAMRTAYTEVPIRLTGAAMLVAPLDEQREVANLSFAGWADTEIRLFESLASTLGAYGANPYRKKLQELPASVHIAWDERRPDEPLTGPKSTVSRVVRLLKETGRTKDAEDISEYEKRIPDEFSEREQARAEIAALREGAGLTPREDQVLDLRLEGYTLDGIADELGVASGTVKSHVHRIIKKLRTSAES